VLKLGCSGTISGLANALPEALGRIYENFKCGISSPSEAQLISSVAEAIKDLAFPLNVKATVAARGFETGEPKNPISASTRKCYTDAVERVSALFPAR
jgi:dihydrodipicolinate synthase/N-acetylneuraminate lyase